MEYFFGNMYEDYAPNRGMNLLNNTKDGVSEDFVKKLENFKKTNLHVLCTIMEKDIFNNGTVYTGSAGLALYFLKCSTCRNERNNDNLLKAQEYVNMKNPKKSKISFICGDAGPIALATVISYKLGSERPQTLPDYKMLAKRIMDLISSLNDSPDEILYGKAGYLYALLFINKYVRDQEVIPAIHVKKVIGAILDSGRQFAIRMKSDSPLLWQWHDKIYLGAAHGVAGILYMLLQARAYLSNDDMQNYVKPTLDWLLRQRFSSGNFPSSLKSSGGDRLVQWCHGAPGYVSLCTLAYEVYGDKTFLDIALNCGEVIWKRGLCKKGYSICHGVSGNAYAFLQLYQTTKEKIHLYRACCFMDWCMEERQGTEQHSPDRPASLFEGLLGRIYLCEDMLHPMDANFPAFCL